MGAFVPWQDITLEYKKISDEFSTFSLPLKVESEEEVAKHNKRASKKMLVSKIAPLARAASFCIGLDKLESKTWM